MGHPGVDSFTAQEVARCPGADVMRQSLRFSSLSLLSSLPLLALAGCSGAEQPSEGEALGTTGLQLSADLTGKSDVVAVRFRLTPVDCDSGAPSGEPWVSDRPLEAFTIPGGIADLENNPLDADSAHAFADLFADVTAGCYDVEAAPLAEGGAPSRVCLSAWTNGVEVLEGQTTEVLLLNQCQGSDPGGIDALAALNHEPELSVEFAESKFGRCEAPRVLCATATDPDRDPLEFAWQLDAASPPVEGPSLVSRDIDPETGAVTECVQFVPSAAGRYDISLRVYDLVWRDGALVRVEDWLALEGYPSESHTKLDLFFYAGDCDGSEEPVSAYDIDLHQLSPVTSSVAEAFETAALRWQSHVVGDVWDIDFLGSGVPAGACGVSHPAIVGPVDDLRIYSSIVAIDGPGGVLGSAGPCVLRSNGLPVVGIMQFDSADLDGLEAEGLLEATILHEMAHVLGVGSLWSYLDLLGNPSLGAPPGFTDTHFTGPQARVAFDAVGGLGYPLLKVPVENELGGSGTRDSHWRESVFDSELMTGFINVGSNPLSRVTIASLADLGYAVSFAGADAYLLPGSSLRTSSTSSSVSLHDDHWDGPVFTVDETGSIEQLSP